MQFSDYQKADEPALDVFNNCLDIVFDEDGCTEHINRITDKAKVVYLLWSFDGEIHNGGFDQLFYNSLGDHCSQILNALKLINAHKSTELLEAALKWFPNSSPSSDRSLRWEQLKSYEENDEYIDALDKLDTEFYKYEDNLGELLHSFVRDNPDSKIYA